MISVSVVKELKALKYLKAFFKNNSIFGTCAVIATMFIMDLVTEEFYFNGNTSPGHSQSTYYYALSNYTDICTPYNYKTRGFLMFSGLAEREHVRKCFP